MKRLLILLILSSCINNEGDISIGNVNTPNDPKNDGEESTTITDPDTTTSTPTEEVSTSSGLTPSDCPSLFIPVPGNSDLSVNDFCVMKYEARNDGSGNAILDGPTITNTPYGNLNGISAFSKCTNYSQNGFDGTFALISNAEWMTIARNIELVDSNWSSGTRGTGKLYVGHSDSSPGSALSASNDDSLGYHLTNNSAAQSLGGGFEQKRTLTLSNSQIIWDFSGNLAEWVDWDASNTQYDIGPNDTGNAFRDVTVLSGSMTANDLQSAFGYGQSEYAGQWYGASSTQGSVYRGGYHSGSATRSGIFTLSANLSANDYRSHMGFRCVYRP